VLVRIEAAGICGSDLHFYHSTPEELGSRCGTVVGHEPAGIVEEVGTCVTAVRPGDRVSVYHWIACGHCAHCRSGYPQFCAQRVGIAAAGYGSSAEYILAPEANCLPLPEALSFVDGALMACCAATAYSALHKMRASAEDDVAIFGLGPVGLSTLLQARALGARTIGIEVVPERLELARQMGADDVVDAHSVDPVEAVLDLTGGRGATKAIESSGSAAARSQIVDVLGHGGIGVYVGLGNHPPTVDPARLIEMERVLMGSYVMPVTMYDAFVRFLVQRDVHPEQIVTHRFTITRGVEAIELFDTRRTGKVVLVPG
jgi:propanol-preferring alcohol dehydrogenase